jgi:hypothetical protein
LERADAAPGWRLTSINELRSIVERCRAQPAVNRQVFPDTLSSAFWTATPSAGVSTDARDVDFRYGGDNWLLKSQSSVNRVRLVLGGQ